MYPHERSLVKEYSGRPFALIGVNSDSDREKVRSLVIEKDLSWRSFWNGGSTEGPISTRWNVSGWPTVYIIDHEGVIYSKDSYGEEIDRALAMLVKRAEAAAK